MRRRVTVTAVGARRYVDGHDGHVVFERLPRHPEPRAAGQAGSLDGDDAGGGAPRARRRRRPRRRRPAVVVIEAMKMEHQISAPHAGRVTVVAVAPGQQVEAGTALLEVDP